VTIVCGGLERDPQNQSTVTNPAVVVELLSPSTADYERGEKLLQYQQIATLHHIVLLAHDEARIDVWNRTEQGFSCDAFGPGDRAALPSIECWLDVDAIFRDPLAG
jgi:Uma2 family endonuclease